MPVLTHSEVVQTFGDPSEYIRDDGSVDPEWEKMMVSMPLPAPLPYLVEGKTLKSLRVHHRIVDRMAEAFDILWVAGQWGLLKDCGGCYCWRSQRKAAALSHHAWGIAVDLNCRDNPFQRPPKMPVQVVRAFMRAGFVWGGDWLRRRDGMHFEFYDLGRLA